MTSSLVLMFTHTSSYKDVTPSTTKTIGSRMKRSGAHGRERGQRIATVAPAAVAAGQRPHTLDATTSEEQRHPGARRLVGSGAVQDDVAIAWNLEMPRLQLLSLQVQGTRDDERLSLEVQPVAD